jgi:hypothetical protein
MTLADGVCLLLATCALVHFASQTVALCCLFCGVFVELSIKLVPVARRLKYESYCFARQFITPYSIG